MIDNVFIVVWSCVTESATRAIVERVREAHAVRGEIVYVAVLPADTQPPDDEGRRALSSAVTALLPCCSSMHCVIEGTGFGKSIIRGAATSVFMLSGKRGKMKVHDRLEDALRAAETVPNTKIEGIITRARAHGLPL